MVATRSSSRVDYDELDTRESIQVSPTAGVESSGEEDGDLDQIAKVEIGHGHIKKGRKRRALKTELSPSPPSVRRANGRIPITSIISQDLEEIKTPLPASLLDAAEDASMSEGNKDEDDDDEDEEESKPRQKRKYRVDRDNIKINKRIMSKDTEDVIHMFKKFDEEVLTNPDAKARLLSLGFETRKRYITTFKHYIRFCCKKGLDNFFVTGELMKEFYEEQFATSSSDKPVIRLRKMDPAFSKLQEINFLVYHLKNKEIPNRNIAINYLIYKETGRLPKSRSKQIITDSERSTESTPQPPSPPTPPSAAPEPDTDTKNTYKTFVQDSFVALRSQVNYIIHQKCLEMYLQHPQIGLELAESLQLLIKVSMEQFQESIQQSSGIPKIELNDDVVTVHEILEEWYHSEPSIETRVAKWGTSWIKDNIDIQTFTERKSVIDFVNRLCQECNEPDKFSIATDCDRYIRDKSILDEFISEIECDYDDLFKKILRFRKKRSGVNETKTLYIR